MAPLKGRIIELRPLARAHYKAQGAILNDQETMRALHSYFGVAHWTNKMIHERHEKFMRAREEGNGAHFTVLLAKTGEIVGICGFKNMDRASKNAEFGLILHRSVWGSGATQECHVLCLDYGFKKLALDKVYLMTDARNVRARGFLRKHGILNTKTTEKGGLYYEILSSTWPAVREKLSNFTAGRTRKSSQGERCGRRSAAAD